MRLGPGLLYEGRTLQGARPKLADFCSATMAEFYSAVDTHKFNAGRRDKFSKAKYAVTNWSDYNEALRRRGGVTIWLEDGATEKWSAPKRKGRGSSVAQIV